MERKVAKRKTDNKPMRLPVKKRAEWTHRIADALEMTLRLQVEVIDADNGVVTIFLDTDQCIDIKVDLNKVIPVHKMTAKQIKAAEL